jgi:predicted  nucleic acid-binding Zn ribbon protein
VATYKLGTGAFQEVPVVELFKPISKGAFYVSSASQVAPEYFYDDFRMVGTKLNCASRASIMMHKWPLVRTVHAHRCSTCYSP